MKRMKRLKTMLLGLTLAGPAVTPLACSSTVSTELRDAAIAGAASFVEQTIFDILDTRFGPNLPAE